MREVELLRRSRRPELKALPGRRRPFGWLRRNILTLLLFSFMFALLGGFGMAYLRQQEVLLARQQEVRRLEAELQGLTQQAEQLADEIERLETDEYIEFIARQRLGLIKPGDIPYVAAPEQEKEKPAS